MKTKSFKFIETSCYSFKIIYRSFAEKIFFLHLYSYNQHKINRYEQNIVPKSNKTLCQVCLKMALWLYRRQGAPKDTFVLQHYCFSFLSFLGQNKQNPTQHGYSVPRNSGSGRDRHEEKGGMTGEIRKASVQLNWKTFIKFIYPVFLKQIKTKIN